MESFFPNFLQNKISLSEQHNWFMKVFVSSEEVSCFTPTQGHNKAEVKNTCDGYWPLTFWLEMPLIPLKKETGGEEGKQTKMNSTDFSSKNPRNRQTCFISSPVMRWAKWERKCQLFRAKAKTVRRFEPHAWAPPVTVARHFTSRKPLREQSARTTGIFPSVLFCPPVNTIIEPSLPHGSLRSPPATFPLTPDTLES